MSNQADLLEAFEVHSPDTIRELLAAGVRDGADRWQASDRLLDRDVFEISAVRGVLEGHAAGGRDD